MRLRVAVFTAAVAPLPLYPSPDIDPARFVVDDPAAVVQLGPAGVAYVEHIRRQSVPEVQNQTVHGAGS